MEEECFFHLYFLYYPQILTISTFKRNYRKLSRFLENLLRLLFALIRIKRNLELRGVNRI